MSRPDFVFVGGLHRSGTSLVASLLSAHPELQGLEATGVWEDEGQHLQDVLPPARDLGGPGRFGFDPRASLTEADARPGLADALVAAWSPWTAGAARVVEKSPPNLLRFRLLQALFPDACCVAVIRHPLAVAMSTRAMQRKQAWASVPRLVEHWVHCHDRFAADRAHARDILEVRYEALVRDPAAELEVLWAGLGLSPKPSSDASAEPTERARARWRNWRRRARAGDLERLEASAAAVQRHGYDLLAGP